MIAEVSSLKSFSIEQLLEELSQRSGCVAQAATAQLLAYEKGKDYNGERSRDEYFPLGLPSYAQMIHVKSQRLLALSAQPNSVPRFESARDTALDLINYASFAADWLCREGR